MSASRDSTTAASCCASFYEQDWVQQILGESFHPGGVELSTRLGRSLGAAAGAEVLDVACGMGTTTRLMTREFKWRMTGLDFSEPNLRRAEQLTTEAGLDTCRYVAGSADQLPFEDQSFDAVICECAVSTFVHQPQVAREFCRVLRPGGVLGISDMVLNAELPLDFSEHVAPWTCMAKAHSVAGYQRLFLDAGFVVLQHADESNALLELSVELKRKLLMLGVAKATGLAGDLGLDFSEMRRLLDQSKSLVNDGIIGYHRMVLQKDGIIELSQRNELNEQRSRSTTNLDLAVSSQASLPIQRGACGDDGCC